MAVLLDVYIEANRLLLDLLVDAFFPKCLRPKVDS